MEHTTNNIRHLLREGLHHFDFIEEDFTKIFLTTDEGQEGRPAAFAANHAQHPGFSGLPEAITWDSAISYGWMMAHFAQHTESCRSMYHTARTEGGAKSFLCASWILAKIPNFAHLYLGIPLYLTAG
ncbi:hypothetical protein Ddc_20767 [Ditylenchus destructor]|nr:hypothetical protein Ddc_20767 [Ditylenchus destructor]